MTRSVEIPEAAVEAAARAYCRANDLDYDDILPASRESVVAVLRPALLAALPYLAPAGDGGLREALRELVKQKESEPDRRPRDKYGPIGRRSEPTIRISALRDLLAAHPAAPAVPEPASEDAAFVLRPKNSAPVADWKRLDACAAASAQMIQWHAPETAAALIESAVPQPVDRGALERVIEETFDEMERDFGDEGPPMETLIGQLAGNVLAVLAGEQEQVEK